MRRYMAMINGKAFANEVNFADNFLKRLIGLLRHKNLKDGEGLVLNKCKQVHTFGMKFNIDIIFLSETGKVLDIECDLQPGRVSKYLKSASMVVEFKAGTVNTYNIMHGEKINFKAV